MTISEANAANVLLTYLLGKRRGYVLNDPSKDEVREAAELLAAKATGRSVPGGRRRGQPRPGRPAGPRGEPRDPTLNPTGPLVVRLKVFHGAAR